MVKNLLNCIPLMINTFATLLVLLKKTSQHDHAISNSCCKWVFETSLILWLTTTATQGEKSFGWRITVWKKIFFRLLVIWWRMCIKKNQKKFALKEEYECRNLILYQELCTIWYAVFLVTYFLYTIIHYGSACVSRQKGMARAWHQSKV